MKLVSVMEMKAIEADADAHGYSYEKMMMKAGNELAKVVHKRYFKEEAKSVTGLVGPGNNGGDTLVALGALKTLGWTTCAVLLRPRAESDLTLQQYRDTEGEVLSCGTRGFEKRMEKVIEVADVILDGVLGTGFRLPLADDLANLLNLVKKTRKTQPVVAVDCPSGVDCETGQLSDATLAADLTVCMEAVKNGLVRLPAFLSCGEFATVDLGFPKGLKGSEKPLRQAADGGLIQNMLPVRPRDGHKGTFGTVMVVGGSVNYTGAPALAGKAAYASGTGLVRMAVPHPLHAALSGNFLEAIWLLLEDEMGVISEMAAPLVLDQLEGVNCLIIGPGIGLEDTTQRFIQRILLDEPRQASSMGFLPARLSAKNTTTLMPTMVIDADALRVIAKKPDWYSRLRVQSVLTPHPGEMSALTGLDVEEIQKDREGIAVRYAKLWGHVVVLKGALTVVAEPGGRSIILPFATSSLAKAGSGDVLAGLIAGLIAQRVPLFEAAAAGAWIHARAGIEAARTIGSEASITAGDLVRFVPNALAVSDDD